MVAAGGRHPRDALLRDRRAGRARLFARAFIGGIMVGLVEAAGTGCVPDAQKAASYIPAYGMIVLTLTLLLRPTGMFGRRFASGMHGQG